MMSVHGEHVCSYWQSRVDTEERRHEREMLLITMKPDKPSSLESNLLITCSFTHWSNRGVKAGKIWLSLPNQWRRNLGSSKPCWSPSYPTAPTVFTNNKIQWGFLRNAERRTQNRQVAGQEQLQMLTSVSPKSPHATIADKATRDEITSEISFAEMGRRRRNIHQDASIHSSVYDSFMWTLARTTAEIARAVPPKSPWSLQNNTSSVNVIYRIHKVSCPRVWIWYWY